MLYLEYSFTVFPLQPAVEILIAELSDAGFESFLETPEGVNAYIQENHWKNSILDPVRILKNPGFSIEYTRREVPQLNWNAEWEKNFDPVVIDGSCTIRAPFHPEPATPFDIVISPKMSFGTGHHETTGMMVRLLLKEDVTDKRVLDMGCGTGVLAVLAEKKGATHIDAVDIDPWCYLNALENAEQNRCTKIRVYEGDVSHITGRKYDVILANINRNILLNDIPAYASCLADKGVLVLSGFYKADMAAIGDRCREFSLKYAENTEINHWVAVKYVH